MFEVPFGAKKIPQDAGGIDRKSKPECGMVAEMLGKKASGKHPESYSCIPRRQNRGIGGPPLAVFGEIDEHVLKGRIHVPVPESDDERRSIIADRIMYSGE